MIDGVYWYGDSVRWNLGWPNPNPAGAMMAMAIVCCWWLQGLGRHYIESPMLRNVWVWWLLLVELGGWFLLMKTYSRGALVAILCGVCFRLLAGGCRGWRRLLTVEAVAAGVARLGGVAVMLLTTGFIGRAGMGYMRDDASVTNRLDLWAGGLCMVAAEPFRGWGAGESGALFMHWFQDIDASDGYAGMVNSWLHRAVEHGLPAVLPWLWLVVFLVMSAMVLAVRQRESGASESIAAAAAVWVVFAVANGFSTLWIFPGLWWMPGMSLIAFAAVGIVVVQGRPLLLRPLRWCVFASLVVSIAVLMAVWAAGQRLGSRSGVTIESQFFILGNGHPRKWLVMPDSAVLGRDYGKGLRRFAAELDDQGVGLLIPRSEQAGSGMSVGALVLMGGRCSVPLKDVTAARLILIHPAGPPQDFRGFGEVLVLVPALDPGPHARQWSEQATAKGWDVHPSGAIGVDIRAVWPLKWMPVSGFFYDLD